MSKINLEWKKLGFEYIKTNFRFESEYKNNTWSNGELIRCVEINLNEGSTALHYSQQCFEGLKAQRSIQGNIVLFRPELQNLLL